MSREPAVIFCFVLVTCFSCCHGFKAFSSCKIDLGVVLDQSSSLGRDGFAKEKKFVKDLTNVVTIGDNGIYVSILKFSSAASMELFFKEPAARSKALLDQRIDEITIRGGLTQTHMAIDLAGNEMFKNGSGQRDTIPKVLIVITDGQSQSGPASVGASAKKLKDLGINILSIGIGALINKDELKIIASEPINEHVFTVAAANDLFNIVSNVREESCREINCPYKTCVYGEWSAWSGECAEAERFKTLGSMTSHTKVRIGGCAGLSNVCEPALRETKKLPNPCKKKCKVELCKWSEWTDWDKTCGVATRVAEIMRSTKEVEGDDCEKIQKEQGCKETQNFRQETKKILCQCPSVKCEQDEWTSWTTTCGPSTRLRKTTTKPTVVESYFCDSLPKSCNNQLEQEQRYIACPVAKVQETFARKCNITIAPVGCFNDSQVVPRPLPMLILNERDVHHPAHNNILIDWKNWDSYYEEFICRCANKADSMGYSFIGTQFYGECWSGPKADTTYKRDGPAENCIKNGFKKCESSDKSCIGEAFANYVYMIER